MQKKPRLYIDPFRIVFNTRAQWLYGLICWNAPQEGSSDALLAWVFVSLKPELIKANFVDLTRKKTTRGYNEGSVLTFSSGIPASS